MPMIILALALSTQSVKLEADTREAVLTCGAAVRALPDSLGFANTAVGMWFAMKGASIGHAPAEMLNAIGPAMRDLMGRVDQIGDKRDSLLAECHARFPLAWKTSGVVLPTEDYERRITCAFNAITLVPLAKAQEDGKYAAKYEGLANRFAAFINEDELQTRAAPRSTVDEAARVMISGLDMGNLLGIATACEAAFPG